MSAANLLRHSRKLRSLRNVVDCERSGLACYFSTGSGSFVVMENETGHVQPCCGAFTVTAAAGIRGSVGPAASPSLSPKE